MIEFGGTMIESRVGGTMIELGGTMIDFIGVSWSGIFKAPTESVLRDS